jgi:hypothetical protein
MVGLSVAGMVAKAVIPASRKTKQKVDRIDMINFTRNVRSWHKEVN